LLQNIRETGNVMYVVSFRAFPSGRGKGCQGQDFAHVYQATLGKRSITHDKPSIINTRLCLRLRVPRHRTSVLLLVRK
jgi:hypothetical protein